MGALTITGSTISGNQATGGSAVGGGFATSNPVTATLINSTVAGNSSDGNGAGLYTEGTLNLQNATIAGNTADADSDGAGDGGGIFGFGGSTINMRNSILADNVDASTGGPAVHPDCSGSLNSQGYNLIENTTGCTFTPNNDLTGMDPVLGPLADNGGPTQTKALLPGSPALNAGNPAMPGGIDPNACPATDQRGLSRTTFAPCDIGAFEVQDFDTDADKIPNGSDNCPTQAGPLSNGGCPLPVSTPAAPASPAVNLKAAVKKCKKKFPKGPKRKKCIKRAKRRAGL
jgi:hypothetical protein